eukprot:291827_1
MEPYNHSVIKAGCPTGPSSKFGGTIDCGVRGERVGEYCDLICENDPTKVKKLMCYAEQPFIELVFGEWKGPNCHPVSTDSTFTVAIIVFGAIVVIWFLMVLLVARATKARQRQRHYQKHNTVHVVKCAAPPGTVATAPMGGPTPMAPMGPAAPEFAAPMRATAPEFATPMSATAPEFATPMCAAAPEFEPPPY